MEIPSSLIVSEESSRQLHRLIVVDLSEAVRVSMLISDHRIRGTHDATCGLGPSNIRGQLCTLPHHSSLK